MQSFCRVSLPVLALIVLASASPLRAQEGEDKPNFYTLREPVGPRTTFQTGVVTERVGEFNGVLRVSMPLFTLRGVVGELRYSSDIYYVGSETRPNSGFGLGWQMHFGRFLRYELVYEPGEEGGSGRLNIDPVYAFEYPDGRRTRAVCSPSCVDGITSDFSRFTQTDDGFVVTTRDGMTYVLDYRVREDMSNLYWGGGAEGYYATRIQDRFGNFTEIDYYGSTTKDDRRHSPFVREVRVGRTTSSGDLVTERAYFYLSGDNLNRPPVDHTGVTPSHRLTRVRYPGPHADLDHFPSGWRTVELDYVDQGTYRVQPHLSRVHVSGTQQSVEFDYHQSTIALADGQRLKEVRYPHGGYARYDYDTRWMYNPTYQRNIDKYLPHSAVVDRTLNDRNASQDHRWHFDYYSEEYGMEGELPKTMVTFTSGADPSSTGRTETWFEPINWQRFPFSGRTGRMRHRKYFSSAGAATPAREEHVYTAVFELGWRPGGWNQYVGFLGAQETIVRGGSGDSEHYVVSYRDHSRRDTFTLVGLDENDWSDYDRFGNPPFEQTIGSGVDTVAFTYGDIFCRPEDCRQDTVHISSHNYQDHRTQVFNYAVYNEPRRALYRQANLVSLRTEIETQDRSGVVRAATELYYDNAPALPYPESAGVGDTSPRVLGRLSAVRKLELGAPDRDQVSHMLYYVGGDGSQPSGGLAEESVKVSAGQYRRRRFFYAPGDSCGWPVQPTQTSIVRADGSVLIEERTERDCMGGVRWQEDENGARTTFLRDSLGRVLKELRPGDGLGTPTVEYLYRDHAPGSSWQPWSVTEIRRGSRTYNSVNTFFDGLGRPFHVQELHDPGNGSGRVSAVSTRYYDETERPYEETRPYFNGAQSAGSFSPPQFGSTPRRRYLYDGLGRLNGIQWLATAVERELRYEYGDTAPDLAADEIRVVDENGTATTSTYNGLGEVQRIELPDGGIVSQTYDVLGNLRRVRHPDGTETVQTFDTLSQLETRTAPTTGTTRFTYDLTGAMASRQYAHQRSRGRATRFQYDDRGRLVHVDLDEGLWLRPQITYIYDAYPPGSRIEDRGFSSGRLTRVIFGTSTIDYGYDARGRITEQINDLYGLSSKHVDYQYDQQDLMTRMRYQFYGSDESEELDLSFQYDGNMRRRRLWNHSYDAPCDTSLIAEFQYDVDDTLRRERWLPCGRSQLQGVDYRRDKWGRLTQINHPSLSAAMDPGGDPNDRFGLRLGYDEPFEGWTPPVSGYRRKNGDIGWMQWRTAGNSLAGYVFSYDERNQLTDAEFVERQGTQWTNPSRYDVHATYDSVGNILTMRRRDEEGALSSVGYHYDGRHRLESVDGSIVARFAYDESGNAIGNSRWGRSSKALFYNYRNLLTSARFEKTRLYFLYDADGNRVRKAIYEWDEDEEDFLPGDVIHTVRDYHGDPIAVYRNGKLQFWNMGGIGRQIPENGTFGKPGITFFQRDHLGSVRAAVHEDGTVVETTDYYPFGMEMPGRSRDQGPEGVYKFTGQERDGEFPTPVDYFVARYYDPELGRFLSVDPQADSFPAFSPYAYVSNNPIKFIDPDGQRQRGLGCCDFFRDLNAQLAGYYNMVRKAIHGFAASVGPLSVSANDEKKDSQGRWQLKDISLGYSHDLDNDADSKLGLRIGMDGVELKFEPLKEVGISLKVDKDGNVKGGFNILGFGIDRDGKVSMVIVEVQGTRVTFKAKSLPGSPVGVEYWVTYDADDYSEGVAEYYEAWAEQQMNEMLSR